MINVGFSTGAIALSDFSAALDALANKAITAVELSALRLFEVEPLVNAIPTLNLSKYLFKSFHAPSSFSREEESKLARLLFDHLPVEWPIVLHPDSIYDFEVWVPFKHRIAIENMDRRKPVGRSAHELQSIFNLLPKASLCFDIGHARQFDASMTEGYTILKQFGSRLVQVHISEVNSSSQHERISFGARLAFEQLTTLIPEGVPLILESRVTEAEISEEVNIVCELFEPIASAV